MICRKVWRTRLFALMMLGDDRAVAATYVAGACVHRQEET